MAFGKPGSFFYFSKGIFFAESMVCLLLLYIITFISRKLKYCASYISRELYTTI